MEQEAKAMMPTEKLSRSKELIEGIFRSLSNQEDLIYDLRTVANEINVFPDNKSVGDVDGEEPVHSETLIYYLEVIHSKINENCIKISNINKHLHENI